MESRGPAVSCATKLSDSMLTTVQIKLGKQSRSQLVDGQSRRCRDDEVTHKVFETLVVDISHGPCRKPPVVDGRLHGPLAENPMAGIATDGSHQLPQCLGLPFQHLGEMIAGE